MSDTTRYAISIRPEDQEYFKEFNSRQDWRDHMASLLREKADEQLGKSYVRYALLAILLLVSKLLLMKLLGDKLPSWGINGAILAAIVAPTLQFIPKLRTLRHFTTPERFGRFLGIMRITENGKRWADKQTVEYVLRRYFNLEAPTRRTSKGKIKRDKDAADPYYEAVSFSDRANILRYAAWISIILILAGLVLATGYFWTIAEFTVGYMVAVLVIWRYRSAAMSPVFGLLDAVDDDEDVDENEGLDILNPHTDNEPPAAPATTGTTSASTPKKEKKTKKETGKAAAKKTAPAASNDSTPGAVSDEDLLEAVKAYHTPGASLTPIQEGMLKGYFPEGVPTVDELKMLLAEAPSAAEVTPPAAPATTGTTTDNGSGQKPPLPRREPKKTAQGAPRHARRDNGSTGTPAHGTPVYTDPATAAPAPSSASVWSEPPFTSAPAAPDPQVIGQLLKKHYDGKALTPGEHALILPYL